MPEQELDDAKGDPRPWLRKQRIALGGISAPIAIIVAFAVNDIMEKNMSNEVIIAISSLIGSTVTVIGICVWDVRDMIYAMIDRKRE